MKRIIRVFPRRTSMTPTDDMAFVGDPPLERPAAEEVHISVSFTWDRQKRRGEELSLAERLAMAWGQYYPVIWVGGCAYDDPCDSFTPGLYVKRGVTFTSRGCNFQCPWCEAWRREGKIREVLVREGNIVQDNNLLQCSRQHIDSVFEMLQHQRSVELRGLDSRLITDRIAEQVRGLRIKQVFLACDVKEALAPLRKAIAKLSLPRDKIRCYVMVKFDPSETISEATERMLDVWTAGAMPFAQLFQPKDRFIIYPYEWTRFARVWSRPAVTKAEARRLLGVRE